MRTRIAVVTLLLLGTASLLNGHELFMKLNTYFLEPHTDVRVMVLNGTFTLSENSVTRDRITDISVVSEHHRIGIDTSAWDAASDTSFLSFRTGDPGTYVAGVSTRPRTIDLSGADFNTYLEEEGIPDVLEERRRAGDLDVPVRELYSKHVKAVFQVGDLRTTASDKVFGYPAEIIPLVSPYAVESGARLGVRCLVHGRNATNLVVMAGGEGSGDEMWMRETRTDAAGIAWFTLDRPGKWFVKFIHMVPSDDPNVNYESNWATLTFEIK